MQPGNEESDRTASSRRRRRFKAAIGVVTAAAAYLSIDRVRRPMHNSALRGMDKVHELLANSNENAMFNKVRMGPRDFMILCDVLTEKGLLRPSYNMSVPEQLFVFLTIISQSQSNREAQDAWQHSGETISRRFTEVLDAICALHEDFIKPPNYDKVPQFLRGNRQRYGAWFDDCVGTLDGTHVPCTPIGVDNPVAYRNRNGVNSLNILAACSFDMKFTYILSGWEGSAHDAKVLTDALENPKSTFPRIPPSYTYVFLFMPIYCYRPSICSLIWICYTGKYYLVDAAYANNDRFLAPYRGGTYHLPDYRRRSGGFRGPRDIFNYKHSSLRNCIERTFGIWKARFPILRRPNNTYPMDKQVKIPVACAILHNFIRMVNEGDPLLSQYDRDGVPVSEIDPTNDDEFDDDDTNVYVPEGPVVTGGSVSRTEMGRFRDRLANEMWVEYQRSRARQI